MLDHRFQRGGQLAGLALKRRWRASGGSGTANIVMGNNVQVCWDKFANYFEVEPRLVPMAGERFHLDAAAALPYVDANYLGDEMATFALNFSRPGAQVVALLRFVIRNGMTLDLAQVLLADLRTVLVRLSRQRESTRDPHTDASFAHDGRPTESHAHTS